MQYNPVSSMVCLIISSVFKVVRKVVQNLRRETNLFFKRGYSTGSIVRWRLIFLFFDTWWYKATAMKRNEGRMMMKSMWIQNYAIEPNKNLDPSISKLKSVSPLFYIHIHIQYTDCWYIAYYGELQTKQCIFVIILKFISIKEIKKHFKFMVSSIINPHVKFEYKIESISSLKFNIKFIYVKIKKYIWIIYK